MPFAIAVDEETQHHVIIPFKERVDERGGRGFTPEAGLHHIQDLETTVSFLATVSFKKLALGLHPNIDLAEIVTQLERNNFFNLEELQILDSQIANPEALFSALCQYLPKTTKLKLHLQGIERPLLSSLLEFIFHETNNIKRIIVEIIGDDTENYSNPYLETIHGVLINTQRPDINLTLIDTEALFNPEHVKQLAKICQEPNKPTLTLKNEALETTHTVEKNGAKKSKHYYRIIREIEDAHYSLSRIRGRLQPNPDTVLFQTINEACVALCHEKGVRDIQSLHINRLTITDELLLLLAGPEGTLPYRFEMTHCILQLTNPKVILNTISFVDTPLPNLKTMAQLSKIAKTILIDCCETFELDPLIGLLRGFNLLHPLRRIRFELDEQSIASQNNKLVTLLEEAAGELISLQIEIYNIETQQELSEQLLINSRVSSLPPNTSLADFHTLFARCYRLDQVNGSSLTYSTKAITTYLGHYFNQLPRPLTLHTLHHFLKKAREIDSGLQAHVREFYASSTGVERILRTHIAYNSALECICYEPTAHFDGQLLALPQLENTMNFLRNLLITTEDNGLCENLLTNLIMRFIGLLPAHIPSQYRALLLSQWRQQIDLCRQRWRQQSELCRQKQFRNFQLQCHAIRTNLSPGFILSVDLPRLFEQSAAFYRRYRQTEYDPQGRLFRGFFELAAHSLNAQLHLTLQNPRIHQAQLHKDVENVIAQTPNRFNIYSDTAHIPQPVLRQWNTLYAIWATLRNHLYQLDREPPKCVEPLAKKQKLNNPPTDLFAKGAHKQAPTRSQFKVIAFT